jgi:hypothetical protein
MKSLKDETSINQVKEDTLLGLTRQPPNTCPLINVLIFNSERSSITYEVDINFNPEDLILHTHDLESAVDQLHQWSRDVIDLFNAIDKTNMSQNELEKFEGLCEDIFDDLHNDIEERLRDRTWRDVEKHSKNINKIIDDWIKYRDSYIEEESELNELNSEYREYKSSLEELDIDDENYERTRYDLKNTIDIMDNKIWYAEKSLSKTKTNFENYVESYFPDETEEFSAVLEKLRENNDCMRTSTHTLKKGLIQFVENEFNLMQPMDYLKKMETGRNDEISLGVIDRMSDYMVFSKLAGYLFKHDLVSTIQRDVLMKTNDVDAFVDMVHNLGYNTVRYYKNEKDYINHPEIYIEKNIKITQEKNYNSIPKIK